LLDVIAPERFDAASSTTRNRRSEEPGHRHPLDADP
jgi:hypothetical protein